MGKKDNKQPGDKGTTIDDVVKEELDPEGLPVIDRTEKAKKSAKSNKNPEVAVRVMAVRTYIKNPQGIYVEYRQNDLIRNPWPELLEQARADIKGLTLRIVTLK